MYTIACCLVARLGSGLGLGLDFMYGWQVVMHTYSCDFMLQLSRTGTKPQSRGYPETAQTQKSLYYTALKRRRREPGALALTEADLRITSRSAGARFADDEG